MKVASTTTMTKELNKLESNMTFRHVYKDNFGNTAFIEEGLAKPYNGANYKLPSYRLVDMDEDGFVYHVSLHDSLKEAQNKLSKHSLNTFKQVTVESQSEPFNTLPTIKAV